LTVDEVPLNNTRINHPLTEGHNRKSSYQTPAGQTTYSEYEILYQSLWFVTCSRFVVLTLIFHAGRKLQLHKNGMG